MSSTTARTNGIRSAACEEHLRLHRQGPLTRQALDEGFIQLGGTEPVDTAQTTTLRATESIFTWEGWSLCASRPGRASPLKPSRAGSDNHRPASLTWRQAISSSRRGSRCRIAPCRGFAPGCRIPAPRPRGGPGWPQRFRPGRRRFFPSRSRSLASSGLPSLRAGESALDRVADGAEGR